MKKNSVLILIFSFLILISLFFYYQSNQTQKLSELIEVKLQTDNSICQNNQTHPIQLLIQNNTDKIITHTKIKYSSFKAQTSHDFGDYASAEFVSKSEIKPQTKYTICVPSPSPKVYMTLTQEDMDSDGESIKKNYPFAQVGFNVYASDYTLKVESQQFKF